MLPAGGIIARDHVGDDGWFVDNLIGALAISDGSNVILSGCLVILTPSRVNVDAWHGGMTASVHQCRSVGIQVHDSRDSSSGLHPTFCCCFSSFTLTSIHSLSPNGLAVGGIPCQDRDQMAQADWVSGVL